MHPATMNVVGRYSIQLRARSRRHNRTQRPLRSQLPRFPMTRRSRAQVCNRRACSEFRSAAAERNVIL